MIFGLITWGVAAAIGVVGHTRTRAFVGRRLRFTKVVEKPAVSVAAGLGATAVVAIVASVPIIPFVGAAAAIAAGIGVGTGVALGSKDAKNPPPLLED